MRPRRFRWAALVVIAGMWTLAVSASRAGPAVGNPAAAEAPEALVADVPVEPAAERDLLEEAADVEEAEPEGPAAEAPDATPDADALIATVQAVQGTVEARPSAEAAWVKVEVGQSYGEGTDLRTGFRSLCTLDMRDSLVQIEPLTLVRIGELRQEGDTVRTRLYMKQGNTSSVVEEGKIQSDFAIVTPSATLSVRGTRTVKVEHFEMFGTQTGLTHSGLLAVLNQLGRQALLAAGEQTDGQGTLPVQYLYFTQLLQIMDPYTFTPEEIQAASRRNLDQVLPPGTGGPFLPPGTNNPPPENPNRDPNGCNGPEPPYDPLEWD